VNLLCLNFITVTARKYFATVIARGFSFKQKWPKKTVLLKAQTRSHGQWQMEKGG